MTQYKDMATEELQALKADLEEQYGELKARGLALNMARGKPAPVQLDLSAPLLDILDSQADMLDSTGTDVRNYGAATGIPEAKELMAQIMGVPADEVIVGGNSSLNLMFDAISRAFAFGILGNTPWCKLEEVKFLCPAPGYDRHFGVTEHFGIQMTAIPMTEEGPDMDLVEELVSSDPAIKGIWCVPKYSNPQGITYSDQVVRRFAALKPAAPDFRIFWDNAYVVHDLYDEGDQLLDLREACIAAGNPDLYYMFASTSKVSFAGGGISAISASPANLEQIAKSMSIQTIGHDKINQLRHARYFKDLDGVKAHMAKHAQIIRPKFQLVQEELEKELGGLGIGEWTKPRGGYFVSFQALPGCAKAIVAKAKEAGVTLTGAGATYPYKQDPQDSNIRIAPTYPDLEELGMALQVFTVCVKLVSVESILAQR